MLKMCVIGEDKQLDAFINHFQSQEYYNIQSESYQSVSSTHQLQEVCLFFEFNTSLLKPTIRPSFWVHMKTESGQAIQFPLLDGKITKMDDGSMVVSGKNFDIFSSNTKND